MIVQVALVRGMTPEYFNVDVTPFKYMLVKKRLDLERDKIVRILKRMKKDKLIKSIHDPRNKKMQGELDALIKAKQVIRKAMRKLTDYYT